MLWLKNISAELLHTPFAFFDQTFYSFVITLIVCSLPFHLLVVLLSLPLIQFSFSTFFELQ